MNTSAFARTAAADPHFPDDKLSPCESIMMTQIWVVSRIVFLFLFFLSELVLDERRRIMRRLDDLCREGEELIIGSPERRLAPVMMFCLRSVAISPNIFLVSESQDAPPSGRLQRQHS